MILFAGDPHGRFEHIVSATIEHRPTAVVILGDLQPTKPLQDELAPIVESTAIWFIPGNHDTDSEADFDNLFGSSLADRNLHGRVVEIAGLRVAGLGGVFRKQVWLPPDVPRYASAKNYLARCGKGNWWRGGLPLKHRSTIFPDVYDALAKQRADVLVTHEAPALHPYGFQALDVLAARMGARWVFHGHHHETRAYEQPAGRSTVRMFGVGLRGLTDLQGSIVRSGDP